MFTGLKISFKNNLANLAEGFICTYRPIGCDFLYDRITYQISNTIQVKFTGIIELLKNISVLAEIIFFFFLTMGMWMDGWMVGAWKDENQS